jgi:hypothetical protein
VNGSAVNITTPATGKESVLYVSKGASVGVGVDVSDAELTIGTGGSASSLNVESKALLYFEEDATLAVTNDPAASKVKLETTDSTMTLATGANLDITVTIDPETEAAADKIIGGSDDKAVIEIVSSSTPAAIGEVDVTVEVTIEDDGDAIKDAVTDSVGEELTAAAEASPAKTTAEADDIAGLFTDATHPATSVTYTGEDGTLAAAITLNADQTLIVNGSLTVSTGGSITGEGNLVVASGATVVVDAEGTVDVSGASSSGLIDVTAKHTLPASNPGELAIESAKKDLAEGLVTITLTGNAGRTITNETVYNDMFGADGAYAALIPAEAAKGYSAVVINGLYGSGSGNIKQSNLGFNMWKQTVFEAVNAPGQGWGTANVFRQKDYNSLTANGSFSLILWNGATPKTITLEITQPKDGESAKTQKFLIDYNAVTFEAPIITVAEANVYTSAGEVLSLGTSITGNVKIGDIPVGIVTAGKLSFTLPETAPSGLSAVSAMSEGWGWSDVVISEPSAQVRIWDNLYLYNADEKTGKLSFGSYYTPPEGGRAFREVKYMYFDKACTISGTYNNGNRVFNARKGWNLFHDFGGSIHSDNFDHFIDEFKWVYTAYVTSDLVLTGADTGTSYTVHICDPGTALPFITFASVTAENNTVSIPLRDSSIPAGSYPVLITKVISGNTTNYLADAVSFRSGSEDITINLSGLEPYTPDNSGTGSDGDGTGTGADGGG